MNKIEASNVRNAATQIIVSSQDYRDMLNTKFSLLFNTFGNAWQSTSADTVKSALSTINDELGKILKSAEIVNLNIENYTYNVESADASGKVNL